MNDEQLGYLILATTIIICILIPGYVLSGMFAIVALCCSMVELNSGDIKASAAWGIGGIVALFMSFAEARSRAEKLQRKVDLASKAAANRATPPPPLPPPRPSPAPVASPPVAQASRSDTYSDYDHSIFWCDRNRAYYPKSHFCNEHSELNTNGGRFSLQVLAQRRMDDCMSCRWQRNSRAVRRSQGLE